MSGRLWSDVQAAGAVALAQPDPQAVFAPGAPTTAVTTREGNPPAVVLLGSLILDARAALEDDRLDELAELLRELETTIREISAAS
jgi:hypothetical protein